MRNLSLIGLCCAGLLLNCPAGAQSSSGVVRIGILNDQSGPYADFGGKTSVDAARMAVEDMGGKVLGKSIKVIIGDHQNKPDIASAIARRWIDVDGVSAIAELGRVLINAQIGARLGRAASLRPVAVEPGEDVGAGVASLLKGYIVTLIGLVEMGDSTSAVRNRLAAPMRARVRGHVGYSLDIAVGNLA
jgi:hypothetical protein